jgi:molybdenum cofactor biosynthesis enzyme
MKELSHLDEKGQVCMVDVTAKAPTLRQAVARGKVRMRPETAALIQEGGIPKGDVFATARIVGNGGGIVIRKRRSWSASSSSKCCLLWHDGKDDALVKSR